jgi:ABC-type nitrate/sulfonate/bicarbonate transport system ATPase subunit
MIESVLEIKNLAKSFDEVCVFSGLNLRLDGNEIVAILGPSGCGKSTLLRCIVGLEEAERGEIRFASKRREEGVGYLFQQPILYPHLNVAANIALGFKAKPSKKERQRTIARELESVELDGFESRRVESLSGGEAQRIALLRAMLGQPEVLLLDEPFSALDLETRRSITVQTRKWLKQRNTAAIHVTHDPEEAELMADRVVPWQALFDHFEEE